MLVNGDKVCYVPKTLTCCAGPKWRINNNSLYPIPYSVILK